MLPVQLDLLCFVLFVYTWLLDNRTLLLLIKAALQVQFCNPLQMHPTWSLPFFVVFLCSLNALLAIAHLWSPPKVTNTGDAILIDFVGQATAPGRLHMLLVDAAVCAVQLVMTVVAFEMGRDEVRPDDDPSALDDLTRFDDEGQGWEVRDEEATLFGLDPDEERKRERTSLTHHIAVVQLRPIYDQIVARQLLPSHPTEHVEATSPAPVEQESGERPDTSRLRRFSRRARTTNTSNNVGTATATVGEGERYAGLGPVSADESWPPMWLVIARNMGTGQSLRLPSFRPGERIAALRDGVAARFGRSLTHVDRTQYARLAPDAPLDR